MYRLPVMGGEADRPGYPTGRPGHMRRSRSASPDRSSKRRKREDLTENVYRDYRDRSPDSRTVFVRSASPPRSNKKPDSYRPSPRQSNASARRPQKPNMQPQQHNRASASSRIRSLRKLLANSSQLPPPVRQEKERELASLVIEHEKKSGAKSKRKMTGKYHFVRFIERQKAERNLKRLEKELKAHRQDSREKEDGPEERRLEKEIAVAKVDVAYTVYTPLNSKYISLFVENNPLLTGKISHMPKKDREALTQEELEKILQERDDNMGIIRNSNGEKPPGWYVVEKLMGNVKALERLRDEATQTGATGGELTIGIVGGKKELADGQKPAWMDDDGLIDPKDLDSESDSNSDGGVNLDVADEDLSDGGFFE